MSTTWRRQLAEFHKAVGIGAAVRKHKADAFPPLFVAYELSSSLLALCKPEERESLVEFRERFLAWALARYTSGAWSDDYEWERLYAVSQKVECNP